MVPSEAPSAGKPGRSVRNSTYLSEFAKKVRLRVKRVKRHAKPNVYNRRKTSSEAKVKASETECPVANELCSTVVSNERDGVRNEMLDHELAFEENTCLQQRVCVDMPDNDLVLGEEDYHVLHDAEPDPPKLTHVSNGRDGVCMEDGEIDASQDADCYMENGKDVLSGSSDVVPHETVAANLSGPALMTDKKAPNKEHLIPRTTVSSYSLPNSAFREVVSKSPVDDTAAEGLPSDIVNRDHEMTFREHPCKEYRDSSVRGKGPPKVRSMSVSAHDGVGVSESSKMDSKDHTVLETLLPDEPPAGFSLNGVLDGGGFDYGSGRRKGRTRKQRLEREAISNHSQTDESGSDGKESGEGCSVSEHSGHEVRGVHSRHTFKPFSPGTPGRGAQLIDQVPSVLCDAEGNVWHIGKRAEQVEEGDGLHMPGPPKARFKERRSVTLDQVCQHRELPELEPRELPADVCLPFSHQVPLIWKEPLQPDLNLELPSRRMVFAKEKSIFVGCIPDGVENLEETLYDLMDRFLERFDFAPVTFGQVEGVKVIRDIAFIELTSDKVAQIVLAANQLDVFEWGVNGYHFNVQGCTSTYTSVRPLIEYLPLKPARVLFVGNIPKLRWQREYLGEFFSRMLQGSDGPIDLEYVVSVFLLPESCDAYVEMASEIMADSIIFKCTKNPELLKGLGEDVIICRDASSVPLMSRHIASICPQRSLIIVVPHRAEYLKINAVLKVFVDLLPFIAKKSNLQGYLEYVRVEPGKDYAFFQFSSEAFVDAIMDEYIESTQIFLCRSPASYIILRPPDYVRPGAKFCSGPYHHSLALSKYKVPTAHGFGSNMGRQKEPASVAQEQTGSISFVPRRFGDEPVKKPDIIVSIGVTPVPLATWNGRSSAGACSADPGCMITVQGLPRGLSFKLARGALNELFERLLSDSALLEVGMLVVRYLDRDGNFEVASLPSAEFVSAILSMNSVFIVAGEEVSFLPYVQQKSPHGTRPTADFSGPPYELSSLSDEDSQGMVVVKSFAADEWNQSLQQPRRRGYPEVEARNPSGFESAAWSSFNHRNHVDDEWGNGEGWNPKHGSGGYPDKSPQQWHDAYDQQYQSWNRTGGVGPMRSSEDLHCQGNNPRVGFPPVQKGNPPSNRNKSRHDEAGARFERRPTEDGFRIVSRVGRRTIQQVGNRSLQEGGGPVGMVVRKRNLVAAGIGGPVRASGYNHKVRRSSQFS